MLCPWFVVSPNDVVNNSIIAKIASSTTAD